MTKKTDAVSLAVGRTYSLRGGGLAQIVAELSPGDIGYDHGYRYIDANKNTYLPDGRWSIANKKTDRDILVTVHD